jgi:hypothetical protein
MARILLIRSYRYFIEPDFIRVTSGIFFRRLNQVGKGERLCNHAAFAASAAQNYGHYLKEQTQVIRPFFFAEYRRRTLLTQSGKGAAGAAE